MVKSEITVDDLKLVSSDTILSAVDSKIGITLYINGDSDPIHVNVTFIEVETISKSPITLRNTESALDLIIEVKMQGAGALRKPFAFAENDETNTSLYITFRVSPANKQLAFSYNIFESVNPDRTPKKRKKDGKK